MPTTNRAARASAQLRQELARLLAREIADPRLEGLIVSNVTMTSDLRLAKVFWRLAPMKGRGGSPREARCKRDGGTADAAKDEAETALERAKGRLRRAVTARLGLRFAPELRFLYDAGQEARDRIEELLHEVRTSRDETASGRKDDSGE